ncbi:hypothetical protein [Kaarinaea lacus]
MNNCIKTFTLLLLLAIIAACSPKEPSDTTQLSSKKQEAAKTGSPIQTYSENIPAFPNIAEKSLPELSMVAEGKTPISVSTCKDFINNVSQYTVEETEHNMRILADYQQCIISWLAGQAKPARVSFLQENFSPIIIDELDLTSFASSLGPRLDENKNTLATFSFNNVTESADKVSIIDEGWTYEFALLGRGDFNNDGREDLLVRFLDQSGDASYFSLQTLILEKANNKAGVSALDAIDLIKSDAS